VDYYILPAYEIGIDFSSALEKLEPDGGTCRLHAVVTPGCDFVLEPIASARTRGDGQPAGHTPSTQCNSVSMAAQYDSAASAFLTAPSRPERAMP